MHGVRFVEFDVRRLDGHSAAGGHGVSRIDDKIRHDLFELPGVGSDDAQIGSEDRHQVDLFPDEATQHLTHIANQSIEVHRDWL